MPVGFASCRCCCYHYCLFFIIIIVTVIAVCCTVVVKVPSGSPSRGGDVTVCVYDINQPSLPTPFHSALVSVSVFMALSTVFHSEILPTILNFLALFFPVLFLPYWSCQLCVSS